MGNIRRITSGLIVLALVSVAFSASAFTISDIRIEGLQRMSAGSVFAEIPYNVGDEIDAEALRQVVKDVFKTGSFNDVQVGRDGNVLVIVVEERPAIDSIEIEGNKAIKTEALLEGLEKSGLAEGEIFKQVTLEHIRTDLERQYVSQGRYGASIVADVKDLPRNRVALKINVTEGSVSSIQHINIVGNKVFDNKELRDVLELKLPSLLSFYTKDNQYSKEKLTGDLEKLESFYLDRGYLNFVIDSTQVAISPSREDVYITVNIIEGEKFTVSDVEIAGELHDVPEAGIRALLSVGPGQVFSRQLITDSEERDRKSVV